MTTTSLDTKGKITEEGLRELRSRIGSYYKVTLGNIEVTVDMIRHFATAVGDLNPLWIDEAYAKKTRWGGIIAPPGYLYGVIYATGMRAGGLPGVHAFHSGNNWEWYKPIRVGDVITGTYQLKDVVEKKSEFSGRTVIVYAEVKYFNQLDELVAKTMGWSIRAERQAAREKGKYKALEPYRYTDEEVEAIYKAYENEEIRGATPRYWENVNVGDEIPAVVKGPFTPEDEIKFREGVVPELWGIGISHGLKIRELQKHPAFSFRDPETGALASIAEVHTMSSAASGAAIPAAYDLGSQRNIWLAQPLTNWMGDDGFLKKLNASYRRFNIYGDTQWIKGKVTKKYVENGEHLVDLDVWCENQRGENTTPGQATIILPARTNTSR